MKLSVRAICLTAMSAAVTAVLSIVTIPTPWGVPFTLQTFAVALGAYVLGARYGTAAVALYVLLGFVGVPVYAGMKAGPAVLLGPTGGYLFGFLPMAFLCGAAADRFVLQERRRRQPLFFAVSALGLLCCHVPGIIQLRFILKTDWATAAMTGSVPYLFKDVLSVAAAAAVAAGVKKGLSAAGMSAERNRA